MEISQKQLMDMSLVVYISFAKQSHKYLCKYIMKHEYGHDTPTQLII
jgi:hypothetical protein